MELLDYLKIIHYTGALDYSKYRLLFLVFIVISLLLLIILSVFVLFYSLKKRKPVTASSYSKAILLWSLTILIVLLSYSHVSSLLLYAKGFDYYQSNNYDKAQAYIYNSIKIDSELTVAQNLLLDILEEKFINYDLFVEYKAFALEYNVLELLSSLGYVGLSSKWYGDSVELFERAIDLDRSKNASLNLALVKSHIYNGDLDSGIRILNETRPDVSNRLDLHTRQYLYSLAYYIKGVNLSEDKEILSFLNQQTFDPELLLLQHKIHYVIGNIEKAKSTISKLLYLYPKDPDANFQMAKFLHSIDDDKLSDSYLKKAFYFNNKLTEAFVLHTLMEKWPKYDWEDISRMKDINVYATPTSNFIYKGQSLQTNIKLEIPVKFNEFSLFSLDPYGFGITTKILSFEEYPSTEQKKVLDIKISIRGNRTDMVNLGKPWQLNLVLLDTESGLYYDTILQFSVKPDPVEEGRIVFVITEDLEVTSDSNHQDETPDRHDLTPRELHVDLIEKLKLADNIGNSKGFEWSHIVDVESTFERLKWLTENTLNDDWSDLEAEYLDNVKKSKINGNDFQLHTHSYNNPYNENSRQVLSDDADELLFDENIPRLLTSEDNYGSWANHFSELGTFFNPYSRTGSVFKGIKLLEEKLTPVDPNYRTIFFRAGEYDFGSDKESILKSILALKLNKILCDSDAIYGNPFNRDFKFFRKIGSNVYFTTRRDIRKRATSLNDIGILEMIPVPQKHGKDYIRPIDDYQHVEFNYNLCLQNGKIKPGIHIIMEMFHLNNINADHDWDNLHKEYGDWAKITKHLELIRTKLPNLEFMTISDAVKTYLDLYTPDIIAFRTNERKLSDDLYEYDVEFLGSDIPVTNENPHHVSVKPPSYLLNDIAKIELIESGSLSKTWLGLSTYDDLYFRVSKDTGYTMRVYLN